MAVERVVASRPVFAPHQWLQQFCPALDGQFLFLDPVSWQTFQLSEGAVTVLREAASAIEQGQFTEFLAEVDEAGGWPAELEPLVRSLNSLSRPDGFQPGE